jgi:hypothetical protein
MGFARKAKARGFARMSAEGMMGRDIGMSRYLSR